MINQSQDSGSDEIRRLMQDEVIARIPLLLKYTSSAGLRLQVPETDIQIIAGPQAWIASQIGDAATNSCAQREADWRPYHSALSRCAEFLDNMKDGDPITEVPEFLAAKLKELSAGLASQSQAAQPSIEGLTRYDGFCSYDGGGPAEMEVSKDGQYVKFDDVAAHLAGQSQATRAVPEGWRDFLEMWMHDGALQSFSSREKFRKAARELIDAAPTAQEVTQQAAKAETAEQVEGDRANVLPPFAAPASRVHFDDETIEAAALKHVATEYHNIAHLIPNYRCTEQFARLKAFAEELASGFCAGRNAQPESADSSDLAPTTSTVSAPLESFATRMRCLDPHSDVSATELVESIRKDAEEVLAQRTVSAPEEVRNQALKEAEEFARCYDLGTPDGHAIADAIRALRTTPGKGEAA